MEVLFTIAINKKRMDIVNIKKADFGAGKGLEMCLDCLCNLDPNQRLLIPIHHFLEEDAITDAGKLMLLKRKIHNIIEGVFDSALQTYCEQNGEDS